VGWSRDGNNGQVCHVNGMGEKPRD
jgi:hypothetical protein